MALHKVYGRLPQWLRTYTYWKITQQRCIAVDAAARLLNTAVHTFAKPKFVRAVRRPGSGHTRHFCSCVCNPRHVTQVTLWFAQLAQPPFR